MRKFITLLLLLVSGQIFSQDNISTIIKKNGEEVKAKVEEITLDMVKYREFENLNGPIYDMSLADVFMIKYANGTSKFYGDKKEVKATPTPTQTPTLSDTVAQLKKEITTAKTYSKYDSLMKASKSNKTWGIFGCVVGPVFIIPGAVLIAIAPKQNNNPNDPNADLDNTTRGLDLALGSVLIIGGALELILGPVCIVKSKKQYEAAQQYKGQVYMSMPSLRLSNFSSRAGIGIGTTITF